MIHKRSAALEPSNQNNCNETMKMAHNTHTARLEVIKFVHTHSHELEICPGHKFKIPKTIVGILKFITRAKVIVCGIE